MSLQKIVELAELTGRIKETKILILLRRLAIHPDPSLEKMLLRKLSVEAGDKIIAPPPFKAITEEDMLSLQRTSGTHHIEVGDVVSYEFPNNFVRKCRFRFPLSCIHFLSVGTTRQGKTCLYATIAKQLPPQTRIMLLDSENDPTYRNLALSFPDDEFNIIDAKDCKINLVQPPPNCPIEIWLDQVKTNLTESCFLGARSANLFLDVADKCRVEREEFTIRHIYDKLLHQKYEFLKGGREYQAYETLKNSLEAIIRNPLFDCLRGINLPLLKTKHTLILCNNLSTDDYALFLNHIILFFLFHFPPELNPTPRLVLAIEELHRLLNPARLKRAGVAQPILLTAVRTSAKHRLSFFFTNQTVCDIPRDITANCQFKAIFNTSDGHDLQFLQTSLSLNFNQRKFVSQLPKQHCIIQYPNPHFPESFICAVDDFPMRSDIEEEVEKRKAATWEKFGFVPLPKTQQNVDRSTTQTLTSQQQTMTKQMQIVLESAVTHPFDSQQEHAKKTEIPESSLSKIVAHLQDYGMIQIKNIKSGGRGRQINLLVPTEKGYRYLDQLKISYKIPPGNGGIEHKFYQHLVLNQEMQEGGIGGIEFSFGNYKRVDVAIERDNKKIAFEIVQEGTLQKEISNLIKDVTSGVDLVIFCVECENTKTKLKARIPPEYENKVEFRLLSDYMKRNKTGEAT